VLLRTLFALLLFTVLGETVVHAVAALAQIIVHRQALAAVETELDAAETAAQRSVADAIAAGASPASPNPQAPSPSPTCVARTQNGCTIFAQAAIAFASPEPSSSASPCPSGSCTAYEQENDAVAEGRIDAELAATATSANGSVLASRTARLSFRTLLVAPYALLSGQTDASVADDGTNPGDDAGAAPDGTAAGTLVDVLYRNRTTGATMPANVWRPQVQNDPGPTPAWAP